MTAMEWATIASLATATLFTLRRANDRWLTSTGRHFNVDRPDPR